MNRSFLLIICLLTLSACSSSAVPPATSQSEAHVPSVNDFLAQPIASIAGFYRVANGVTATLDGKPAIIFVGAHYCPFCAAHRWALVNALERFGTFSGLGSTMSASEHGALSDIPSYDFVHATYTSQWITFDHKELADRNGNTLETIGQLEQDFVNRFNQRGSIPFTVIGGMYVRVGPAYNPTILQGKSFDDVKHELQNPASPITQAIIKDADSMTALICKITQGQPADVCNTDKIHQLMTGT